MSGQVLFAEVTDEPLSIAELTAGVGHQAAGAVVTFTGVVRNHDIGQAVDSIEYSSHPQASRIIAELAAETAGREGVHVVGVAHRVGHLHVGDVALVAAVAAGTAARPSTRPATWWTRSEAAAGLEEAALQRQPHRVDRAGVRTLKLPLGRPVRRSPTPGPPATCAAPW